MHVIENPQDIIVSRIEDHISVIPHDQKASFEYPERSDMVKGSFTLEDFRTKLDAAYVDCVAYVDARRNGNLITYMYRTKLKEWWLIGSIPEK